MDSTFLLGARDWTDVEVPPHCSALGKVLLAWKVLDLPVGPLESVTDQTLRTTDDLEEDLEEARSRGFAVTPYLAEEFPDELPDATTLVPTPK